MKPNLACQEQPKDDPGSERTVFGAIPVHVNVLVGAELLAAQRARLEKAGVLKIRVTPGSSLRARLNVVKAHGCLGLDDYVGLGRLRHLRQDPQANSYY